MPIGTELKLPSIIIILLVQKKDESELEVEFDMVIPDWNEPCISSSSARQPLDVAEFAKFTAMLAALVLLILSPSILAKGT